MLCFGFEAIPSKLPQRRWHHSHNNKKWLKQSQIHVHWAVPHKATFFRWFDVFSARPPKIFQVQTKISTIRPLFLDYVSVSYNYGNSCHFSHWKYFNIKEISSICATGIHSTEWYKDQWFIEIIQYFNTSWKVQGFISSSILNNIGRVTFMMRKFVYF